MTFLVYFLAAIGGLIVGSFLLLFLLWGLAVLIAKAQLKRIGRVDTTK